MAEGTGVRGMGLIRLHGWDIFLGLLRKNIEKEPLRVVKPHL
jgi:hypothetical protein